MARLTWDNVAAPNFGDAISAQVNAGTLIGGAFDRIAETLRARDTLLKEQDSATAMAKALQIQDAGAWDKLMATQGMAGLGIDPRRASPELMKFVAGYHDELTGNAADAFSMSRAQTEAQQSDYNFSRNQTEDRRQDAQWAEEDAAKQRTKDALAAAYGIVPGSTSKEQARSMIMDDARKNGLNALDTQARLNAVDSLDNAFWQAGPDAAGKGEALPVFVGASEQLSSMDRQNRLKYGADTLSRIYNDSTMDYSSYDSPLDGMVDRARSRVDKATSEEDKAIFADSAGQIASNYNALMTEYNEAPKSGVRLPPEVIAKVLESSIEDNGFIFTGDKLTQAMGKARTLLDQMSDPKSLARLEQDRTAMDRENKLYSSAKAQLEQAAREYNLGYDREDKAMMERAQAKMNAIAASLQTVQPQQPAQTQAPSTGSSKVPAFDDRAQAILESRNAGLSATPEQRVQVAQQSATAFGNGFMNGLGGIGQTADAGLGYVAGGINRILGGAGNLAGMGVGLVSPNAGAGIIGYSDALSQSGKDLMTEGYVAGGAPWQDNRTMPSAIAARREAVAARKADQSVKADTPATPKENDPLIVSASGDPLGAMEVIISETNRDQVSSAKLFGAINTLRSNTNPTTGKALTKSEIADLKGQLSRALTVARKGYKPTDSNDAMKRLLDSSDLWFK